jgi:hypothetical protein
MQREIERMRRMSKIELTMTLLDKASHGINNVFRLGRNIASKAFNITLKAVDLATAPIRGIIRGLNSVLGLAGMGISFAGGVVMPIRLQIDRQNMETSFEVLLGSAEAAGRLRGVFDSDDFQNASFGGCVRILWNEIIAQPFSDWWNSSGREFVGNVAGKIGTGIGTVIRGSINSIFGSNMDGIAGEGLGIAGQFVDGFKKGVDGIDWGSVRDGLYNAFAGALKLVYSNPITGAIATTWLLGSGKT